MSLTKYIDLFKKKKIVVLGDVMLDEYIWGEVSRISPEAPVQVVNVVKEEFVPGGAANVAVNVADLGGQVCLVGVIGEDSAKSVLLKQLEQRKVETDGLVVDKEKTTILKVRVFGRKQQLLRFDYEKAGDVCDLTEKKLIEVLRKKIKTADLIVVSDYAKGVITQNVMESLINECKEKNKMIIVDPKPEHKHLYVNTTLITPNHSEAHKMSGFPEINGDKDIEGMGQHLVKYLNCTVLITRGEKGMSLIEKNSKVKHIPTFAKEVYDIIGAGDTVVATLALCLASGASYEEAATIANYAAGITVGKVGTSTVSPSELKEIMKDA